MDKKKKEYIRPEMQVFEMNTVVPILAGSGEELPSEILPPEIAPFL